jgi:hypothetical protein
MKKLLWLILSLLLVSGLAGGCGEKESLAAAEGPASGVPAQGVSDGEKAQAGAADSAVDLDLTQLSSVMVYSEVFNIMQNPWDYLGKTMKMGGPYYSYYDETTESSYHFVIIEDALACCQQGIEFLWQGGRPAAEDYPEDGAIIEITGYLEIYQEDGAEYFRLATEELTIKAAE